MEISASDVDTAFEEAGVVGILLNHTLCRLDQVSPLASGRSRVRCSTQVDRSHIPVIPDESESQRLQRELEFANSVTERARHHLMKFTAKVLLRSISPPPSPSAYEPNEIKILYRPIAPWTMTPYSPELGFCCDSLLENGRFDPSQDHLHDHLTLTLMGEGSPFISLMSRPGHLYRRFRREKYSDEAEEVALIDPQKLARMGIPCDSVSDLEKRFAVPGAIQHWTDVDYLAELWIPPDCIIATIPWLAFEKVLIDCGIVHKWSLTVINGAADKLLDLSSFCSAIDDKRVEST